MSAPSNEHTDEHGAPRALVDELRSIVGDRHVLTDPEVTEGYRIDWTGRYRAGPAVVVRPATVDEVAAVVRSCARHARPICPQGGNTGLVGGSVPLGGEVVVSTRRLDRLDPVDTRSATVVAGAGVTLAELQGHVADAGFAYGVDLGARDTATLGGTIATNAGGIHVIRHGTTRDQLLGVEAVLADGSVVHHLAGLVKDNTGYHLPGLFCGSEGTLGIVTAATVRLHRPRPERVTALVGLAGVDIVGAAVEALAAAHLPLDAIEFVLREGVELVRSTFGLPAPLPPAHPAYVLVECSDVHPVDARLADAVASIDGAVDAAVATDRSGRAALWRLRELHTEAINAIAPPIKLDITVPIARLGEFVADIPGRVGEVYGDATVWLFGHAGDGNVHVNVTGVDGSDEVACTDLVLSRVIELGGSISAEHGIGRAKIAWLERQRGRADVEAFRAIKRALDPAGLFQPDVLIPSPSAALR